METGNQKVWVPVFKDSVAPRKLPVARGRAQLEQPPFVWRRGEVLAGGDARGSSSGGRVSVRVWEPPNGEPGTAATVARVIDDLDIAAVMQAAGADAGTGAGVFPIRDSVDEAAYPEHDGTGEKAGAAAADLPPHTLHEPAVCTRCAGGTYASSRTHIVARPSSP